MVVLVVDIELAWSHTNWGCAHILLHLLREWFVQIMFTIFDLFREYCIELVMTSNTVSMIIVIYILIHKIARIKLNPIVNIQLLISKQNPQHILLLLRQIALHICLKHLLDFCDKWLEFWVPRVFITTTHNLFEIILLIVSIFQLDFEIIYLFISLLDLRIPIL